MKRAPPIRLNALCVAKMIRYMQEVPSSAYDVAEYTGLGVQACRRYLLALAKEKAIHVTSWDQDKLMRFTTKVYAFGEGLDAPKPKPLKSQSERRRERHERTRTNLPLHLLAA